MIAFLDESIRLAGRGVYVIAAAVVAEGVSEDLRSALREVLLARQSRFHWRNESERQRLRMLDRLRELDLDALVYAHEPVGRRKQERARALCLQRVLWELDQVGVEELVIESREAHNDRRDRKTIAIAQRKGIATPEVRYRFARAHVEPLLWSVDAISCAAAVSVADGDGRYLDRLQSPGASLRLRIVGSGP